MIHVLDAYALMAYFEKEPGYEQVQALLERAAGGASLLLSAVNWGEVYYITLREHGPKAAEEVAHVVATFPIEVVPADLLIARQAATYKATHKMSYADCFAAALAKQRKAILVTGDKEFKPLEADIRITWIQ